jgi:hypothetical protein
VPTLALERQLSKQRFHRRLIALGMADFCSLVPKMTQLGLLALLTAGFAAWVFNSSPSVTRDSGLCASR